MLVKTNHRGDVGKLSEWVYLNWTESLSTKNKGEQGLVFVTCFISIDDKRSSDIPGQRFLVSQNSHKEDLWRPLRDFIYLCLCRRKVCDFLRILGICRWVGSNIIGWKNGKRGNNERWLNWKKLFQYRSFIGWIYRFHDQTGWYLILVWEFWDLGFKVKHINFTMNDLMTFHYN